MLYHNQPVKLTGKIGMLCLGALLYSSASEWRKVKAAPGLSVTAERLASQYECRKALPLLEDLTDEIPNALRILRTIHTCQEHLGLNQGLKLTEAKIASAKETLGLIGQVSDLVYSYFFYSSWYGMGRSGTESKSGRKR